MKWSSLNKLVTTLNTHLRVGWCREIATGLWNGVVGGLGHFILKNRVNTCVNRLKKQHRPECSIPAKDIQWQVDVISCFKTPCKGAGSSLPAAAYTCSPWWLHSSQESRWWPAVHLWQSTGSPHWAPDWALMVHFQFSQGNRGWSHCPPSPRFQLQGWQHQPAEKYRGYDERKTGENL